MKLNGNVIKPNPIKNNTPIAAYNKPIIKSMNASNIWNGFTLNVKITKLSSPGFNILFKKSANLEKALHIY